MASFRTESRRRTEMRRPAKMIVLKVSFRESRSGFLELAFQVGLANKRRERKLR
jgi:hypothetical protein